MGLADDVVAWYDLESDMSDSHSGGYDFTPSGTPAYSAGKVGNALDCVRAENDNGNLTSSAFQTSDADYYWTWWFYYVGTSANHTVFGLWPSGTSNQAWWCYIADFGTTAPRPVLQVRSASGVGSVNNGSNLSGSTWYCVVAYHDASGDVIGIDRDGGTDTNTTAWTTGMQAGGTGVSLAHIQNVHDMDGSLDSVAFFSGTYTTGKRDEYYNSGSGVAYSDISGGGGSSAVAKILQAHGEYRTLRLDGVEFRARESETEGIRRQLELLGLGRRHVTPLHYGLRPDHRRGGRLWAPARHILIPRHSDVPGDLRAA